MLREEQTTVGQPALHSGRQEQTTVGQPALHSGRPGDTQEIEEDQGRDGGTI